MDPFASHSQSLNAPIRAGQSVTPDDGSDLPALPRALYVGSGGDLSVVLADGGTLTFAGVPGGALLPLRAARVRASGTTAGAILALW